MPVLILDDNFHRADTSPGTVGNGWGVLGTDLHILSNQAATDLSGAGDWPSRSAYYPTAARSTRVVWTTPLIVLGGGTTDFYMGVGARYSPADKNGYWFHIWGGTQTIIGIDRVIGGNFRENTTGGNTGTTNLPVNPTPTQYVCTADFQDGPLVGETTITVTITTLADPSTILGIATAVDNTPALQRAGYAAFGAEKQGSTDVQFAIAAEIAIYDLGSDNPDSGTTSIGTIDGFNHNIISTLDASGGTPPLSYSWYRSRSLLFVPGPSNVIAGQTSNTLGVTAPDANVWYYMRRATDSNVTPKTSDTIVLAVAKGNPTYRICEIGDSVTASAGNDYPAFYMNQVLPYLTGPRNVTVFKAAIAGGYLCDGSGRDSFLVLQPRFPTNFYNVGTAGSPPVLGVTQTIATNNCNMASIRLGINDSGATDIVTFGQELDRVIADLFSRGIQWIILHGTTFCHFGTDQTSSDRIALLESYRSVLMSRVNNTTVFAGDFDGWYYYADHPEELQSDGVHPIDHTHLGYLESAANERVFDRIEGRIHSGGGVSVVRGYLWDTNRNTMW